jgi:hypothetical protein
MVTNAVNPAGNPDGRADVRLAEGGTGVAAVAMHNLNSRYLLRRLQGQIPPSSADKKIGRKSAWTV